MVASVITTIMITRYAEQPTKIQIVKEASASGTINVYVIPDRNEAEGEITVNVV